MPQRSVVVIEDDELIASSIATRLTAQGFDVHVAHDGPAGVEVCREVSPDIVVLDLMLPGMDGVEVCRRLQHDRDVPVLMLTARDDEADMLVGLAVGADDYMTKPFSPRELVARINTILRRSERRQSGTENVERLGDIEVDVARRLVRRSGEDVALTATEFDLFVTLMNKRGAVMTREQLLREVWGYNDLGGARTIDSHVRSVRRKLGDGVIRTAHGVGYALGAEA